MADLDHEHHELLVLDIADDAVIANLVAPEMIEGRSLKSAAPLPWVIKRGNPLFKKRNNARSGGLAEFGKLLPGRVVEINRPDQVRVSLRPKCRFGFRHVP